MQVTILFEASGTDCPVRQRRIPAVRNVETNWCDNFLSRQERGDNI